MKKLLSSCLCVVLIGGLRFGGFAAEEDLAGAADTDALLEMLGELAGEQLSSEAPASPVVQPDVVSPAPEMEAVAVTDVVPPAPEMEVRQRESRPTKITSHSAVYNRKEGLASFAGQVYLDDPQYQLHADRVYVFTTESNELQRVVALGHVAITNELRCAYGAKATYSRQNGLVVLYSGDDITAEVVDNSKEKPQTVKGEKIRFWIDSEQVEVLKADIAGPAPTGKLKVDALKGSK